METAILYAVADLFLVNIEPDVIDTMHRGAYLLGTETARSLSSAFFALSVPPSIYFFQAY